MADLLHCGRANRALHSCPRSLLSLYFPLFGLPDHIGEVKATNNVNRKSIWSQDGRKSKKLHTIHAQTHTHIFRQPYGYILPWQEDPASCAWPPARTFRIIPTVCLIHHCCHTSQLGLIDLQLVHNPARLMLISTFFSFSFHLFCPPFSVTSYSGSPPFG